MLLAELIDPKTLVTACVLWTDDINCLDDPQVRLANCLDNNESILSKLLLEKFRINNSRQKKKN